MKETSYAVWPVHLPAHKTACYNTHPSALPILAQK